MGVNKPSNKPNNPNFSSGPCAKRPGWTIDALKDVASGRSHRSGLAVDKLNTVITKSRELLNIPADYKIAIVPGSDTGAVEMAMWTMLGERGVDVAAWETFGQIWVTDIISALKINDVRSFVADYGQLPELHRIDTDRDVVFTWNGTTSGVKIPNGDWIKSDRKGLTICDATSAVFAMDMPWDKLDVTTWSWQKVLGSEAGHGMIALSPRAVERLENYIPNRAVPKLFRLTANGKLSNGPFIGKTINTPSMLAVEDCLDSLKWVESIGGYKGMIERSENNLTAVKEWIAETPWAEFMAEKEENISNTGICFKITEEWFTKLDEDSRRKIVKSIEKNLADDGIAFEIANHRDAPPSFRIWGGSTVETNDIKSALEWIAYEYSNIREENINQAA